MYKHILIRIGIFIVLLLAVFFYVVYTSKNRLTDEQDGILHLLHLLLLACQVSAVYALGLLVESIGLNNKEKTQMANFNIAMAITLLLGVFIFFKVYIF